MEEQVATVQSVVEEQVATVNEVEEQLTVNETVDRSVEETKSESTQSVVELIQTILKETDDRKMSTIEIEFTPIVQTHNIVINNQIDNSQDYKQKMSVLATLSLELYRMITSSLLILFVPQSCGGELCTITENLVWDANQQLYNTGIFFNFFTLFTFTTLYYIELKRENRLIKYLDVNPNLPMSNEAVKTTLECISVDKKNKILSIDKQYQIISYISIGIFAINSLISGIVVFEYYLGGQTTTTLITSLLFMITKLFNIYSISNTEQNIFYSAYMTTRIQFNDLDETYKINV